MKEFTSDEIRHLETVLPKPVSAPQAARTATTSHTDWRGLDPIETSACALQ